MKITTRQIAEHAGVSTATVCRVLNNSGYVKQETKQIVMDSLVKLQKTKYISSNINTFTIGVIIPDIRNNVFLDVIEGTNNVINPKGGSVVVLHTYGDINAEIQCIECAKKLNLDGLIVASVNKGNNLEFINLLESIEIPVVLTDRELDNTHFDGVFIDDTQGGYEATAALIEGGNSKIAIITGDLNTKPGANRLIGYEKALLNRGINVDRSYIFEGNFKYESGYNITKQIIDSKKDIDGLFVSNNKMLEGCLNALEENGIQIGRDISIVGFDGLEKNHLLHNKISFIDRPTIEMGRIVGEKMLKKLFTYNNSGIQTTQKVVLKPKLVLNGSENKRLKIAK